MNSANQPNGSRLRDGDALKHLAPGGSDQASDLAAAPVTYHCAEMSVGHRVAHHHHHRAQLLYAVSGVMSVDTDTGRWIVPPEQAVWIPAGATHAVRMSTDVSMRSLYFRSGRLPHLPEDCRVVAVTPLLRELIARLVTSCTVDPLRIERLIAVLCDEVDALQSPALHLPLPRDPRLTTITRALFTDPADPRDLGAWSQRVGASTRTLSRLFREELGLSFRDWRARLRMLRAVERLGAGENVTRVALDLGYSSPSAFIAMFRRTTGHTPKRYIQAGPAD